LIPGLTLSIAQDTDSTWAVYLSTVTPVIARWKNFSRPIPAGDRIRFLSGFADEVTARRAMAQTEVQKW
jgi:hypothetical protein